MKIAKVNEMRELDKYAIEKLLIKDEILMENAGEASYSVILSVILNKIGFTNQRFVIFCGSGNNGGDGLVVARKLHSMGGSTKIYILGNPENYTGASKTNLEIIKKLNIPVTLIEQADKFESLKMELAHCNIIIDAIFGTGLKREIKDIYYDVIRLINNSNKTVVSLDIPSGINGDTGRIMGTAVKADYTITFGLPKPGNILYPGFEHCGDLSVTHISFPPELYKDLSIEINIPAKLKKRDPDGHKGSFGDALFISGASNYYGAPCFAALSFLKAGGGYSRLASPESITPYISQSIKEIVHIPLESTETGSISSDSKDEILSISQKVDIVVIGPGMSLNRDTQKLIIELTKEINKPLLIDGDGISAISDNPDILKKRSHPTILTPHIGEMARICNNSIEEILENKIEIVKKTAERLNSYIVLKGAHSIIASPDKRVFINLSGNSGMATAGSGDVLTGVIAAMYGMVKEIEEALKTGVFIHGLAGDLAALEKGEDGITANDILEFLPAALKYYRANYNEIVSTYYNKINVI